MNETKHWNDHREATHDVSTIELKAAEARDLKIVAGRGSILFHILISGTHMRPVLAAFKGDSQLRAEQAALAWCRSRWVRDRRTLFVGKTEIVIMREGGQ